MELWHYSGPSATALWNIHDARAGESTDATEYDSDEYESNTTVYPPEANLSRYLRPGMAVVALCASAAYALEKLDIAPEGQTLSTRGWIPQYMTLFCFEQIL